MVDKKAVLCLWVWLMVASTENNLFGKEIPCTWQHIFFVRVRLW